MNEELEKIRIDIINDPMNKEMADKGYLPVYTASEKSKIVIVGQAPGRKAQTSNIPWNDASGDLLRKWLNVDRDTFYNPDIFALVPMDFYYPGKGVHGDNPPRKGFADRWHPLILAHMPDVELIILVGAYSQKYYLGADFKKTLAATVFDHQSYLPKFFPLVHPSPLNFRWRTQNPWFELEVVPTLESTVHKIINI